MRTKRAAGLLAGMKLCLYRESKFLTQVEVAEKVGITTTYLSLLESGRKPLDRKLEKRIKGAIDSLPEKTKIRIIDLATRLINTEVFHDLHGHSYRWIGSCVNDDIFQFLTEGIRVEISTSPSEEEELLVLETQKPLFSGKVLVDTSREGKVRYFLLHRDVEEALEEFGRVIDPKAADLLQKLEPVLVFLFEVRPKTVGEQLNQILKAK
jgi:transcriptional regulator with XRE-family HTH domain